MITPARSRDFPEPVYYSRVSYLSDFLKFSGCYVHYRDKKDINGSFAFASIETIKTVLLHGFDESERRTLSSSKIEKLSLEMRAMTLSELEKFEESILRANLSQRVIACNTKQVKLAIESNITHLTAKQSLFCCGYYHDSGSNLRSLPKDIIAYIIHFIVMPREMLKKSLSAKGDEVFDLTLLAQEQQHLGSLYTFLAELTFSSYILSDILEIKHFILTAKNINLKCVVSNLNTHKYYAGIPKLRPRDLQFIKNNLDEVGLCFDESTGLFAVQDNPSSIEDIPGYGCTLL